MGFFRKLLEPRFPHRGLSIIGHRGCDSQLLIGPNHSRVISAPRLFLLINCRTSRYHRAHFLLPSNQVHYTENSFPRYMNRHVSSSLGLVSYLYWEKYWKRFRRMFESARLHFFTKISRIKLFDFTRWILCYYYWKKY